MHLGQSIKKQAQNLALNVRTKLMHMTFQTQFSPILPLAYRAIFTNFYRVDFNNFCFFCAKQAYKKHVFENCICSCTFYYYILSKLLSNLALGHNYIEKSENTNWCQKASSGLPYISQVLFQFRASDAKRACMKI